MKSGIGFFNLLAVVFITLKLTHYIDWRWRWVLAPLWGPAAAFTIFAVILFGAWLLMKLVSLAVK